MPHFARLNYFFSICETVQLQVRKSSVDEVRTAVSGNGPPRSLATMKDFTQLNTSRATLPTFSMTNTTSRSVVRMQLFRDWQEDAHCVISTSIIIRIRGLGHVWCMMRDA
jgi:hypothetical protein